MPPFPPFGPMPDSTPATTPEFAAVRDFALSHPTSWPRDLRQVITGGTFDPPPWNIIKGPMGQRGDPAGVITLQGQRVAAWGDITRADPVFSVTKSYIGVLAMAAFDRGLIPDLTRPVAELVSDSHFSSPRNRQVTWLQLLQQTSEWHGSVWGIPDSVDRDRQLSPTDDPARFNRATPLQPPGTYWDYNDARVNALCLALTCVYRRNLGDVVAEVLPGFQDRSTWSWSGYGAASTCEVDGTPIEVVVGGGHWGGGMVTSVELDLAFGSMICNGGAWNGRRVLSEAALESLLAPCPLQSVYGALWWLNTERRLYPAAPASNVFATGVGMNIIWVDARIQLVAVAHWLDEAAFPGFVEKVMAATA
ncbi:MAG: serine hydrolase domain-containing protein [Parvibaculaceae bacterium]